MYIALSPKQIKEFFEPIIKLAAQMLENFESCLLKPSDGYNKYRHPVITVSVLSHFAWHLNIFA